MKKDLSYLKPYQFKPKLAKEAVPAILDEIDIWRNEGNKSENQIMGLVMHKYDISHVTARNLMRQRKDTIDKRVN